jgi:lipopolysaccharide transport system ATP-binding protein
MKKNIAIKVEDLSKQYRLGEIGTGTLSHDLNRFFAKIRGKEDPYSIVGQTNDRTKTAQSDYVWALKDINFEVEQGEVLGIIGKNGAGKSTLLKLISQITSPTTGSIKAKGRIASLLEVGTGMHPEMTARENIFLNGAILGMTKKEIKDKFDEIIEFAGCQLYIDTPLKRFSSGMRVRLGFAVAAFLEPEILIVDEVLAVGDAEFQKKAIGKMKDISAGGGRTVLFVSHNMRSVKSLCTKGMLLKNGTIVSTGNIDEIVNEYLKSENDELTNIDVKSITQNKEISINEIALLNPSGEKTELFSNNEQIKIIVTIQVKEPLRSVRTSISICDDDESIIFSSTNQKVTDGNYEEGLYTIECLLPENLFNERNYFVWLSMGIQGVKNIIPKIKIASFNVVIVDHPTVSNHHSNKWPGLVAPVVKWKLNKK